jgi:hypothetical protein
MALTYTVSDFTDASVISATDLNSRFNDISTKFGTIVNSDISSSAAISVTKLSANYEHMLVTLTYSGVTALATGVLRLVPIPDDGKGDWTVTTAELVCTDVGDSTGQIRVDWGRYTAGTWGATSTVVSAVAINSDDSGDNTSGAQALTVNSATLTSGTHRALALYGVAAGTGVLSAVTDQLVVTLLLKRVIANG